MRFIFFLLLSCLSVAARADAIADLQKFIDGTHTAQGRFEQDVTGQSGRKPQASSGSFAFERPGRFRWSYEKPYAQLLVGDGKRFWSYDPDLRQATVKAMGDALGSSPAAILAGDNALQKNFVLKDQGEQDGLDWVSAEPRQQDASFVVIRLGLQNGELRQMILLDHFGQTTVLRFTSFLRNPTLDAQLFHFKPPAGADVVGDVDQP